jgi:hypothetical protein
MALAASQGHAPTPYTTRTISLRELQTIINPIDQNQEEFSLSSVELFCVGILVPRLKECLTIPGLWALGIPETCKFIRR